MRRSRHANSPRWPFWLLLAAWFCANSPQAATYAVLTWLAEARSFTHQQQLTFDVVHLLAGEKTPSRRAVVVRAANDRSATMPLPSVPAAAVLKKIDLSSEKTGEVTPRLMAIGSHGPANERMLDSWRAPPPDEPPRG